jgi:hypothetical protein
VWCERFVDSELMRFKNNLEAVSNLRTVMSSMKVIVPLVVSGKTQQHHAQVALQVLLMITTRCTKQARCANRHCTYVYIYLNTPSSVQCRSGVSMWDR